jgi:RNA recognition motif-containing protein
MPMFKIYVGNLDPRVTIDHIRELFSAFVTIEDAVLVNDPKSGKPKGFAILMVRDAEIGRGAVKATQGKRLLGKTLTINEVMKKGVAAAKAAKEVRQGPFGPHFNRQGGTRTGGAVGARGGFGRRSLNRGPRGPGAASAPRPPSSDPSSTSGQSGSSEGLRSDAIDPPPSPRISPPRSSISPRPPAPPNDSPGA